MHLFILFPSVYVLILCQIFPDLFTLFVWIPWKMDKRRKGRGRSKKKRLKGLGEKGAVDYN